MVYSKITLIIPTIGRDTLIRSLKSVTEVKYPNLEIIISANSCKLLRIKNICKQCDVDPIIMQTEQKLNPAQAKNKALSIATGEFLTFLDDDDTIYKKKLFMLSEYLNEEQICFAAFGQYDVRDCYTGQIKNKNCGGHDIPCFDSLIINNYIASGAIMYRNDEKVRFDESIDFGEEYMMNLKLINKYKFEYIPISMYAWTQNLVDGFTAIYRKKGINWQNIVKQNQQKAIKLWKDKK